MGVVLVVVVLAVVLVGILVVSALRRRDLGTAIGELSRETRRRDATAAKHPDVAAPSAPTGKAVERAAVIERRGVAIEPVRPATPAPFVPPDPDVIGISRRQFFNRSIVGLMGLSLSGFGAACLAFLWKGGTSGFGSAIKVGPIDEVKAQIEAGNGFY
jgi:cytochrome b6-f complex iron-sulfur subunit